MGSPWLAGAWLVDLVIAMTLVEGVVLAVWHRTTGRGVAPRDFVPSLASGLALMLALRTALDGPPGAGVALALLAAGAAHVVDLRRRWNRPQAPAGRPLSRRR